KQAAKNQLPKHLRPISRRPILFQMLLNIAIGIFLCGLMWNRDEFMSEATPAIGLVTCLICLIYTLITALQYRHRYTKAAYQRLTTMNLGLMGFAAFLWGSSVVYFL